MSEEIKEILDYLKPKYDIVDEFGNDYKKVKFKDCKLLLNYITNLQQSNQIKDLQQKVEQLENIRKEAIKATKDVKQFVYDELVDRNVSGATETHCKIMDLLNILNKGSDKE